MIRPRHRNCDPRVRDGDILFTSRFDIRIGSDHHGARLQVWPVHLSTWRRGKALCGRSNIEASGDDAPALSRIDASHLLNPCAQTPVYEHLRAHAPESRRIVPVDEVVGASSLHKAQLIEIIEVGPIIGIEIVTVDVVIIARSQRTPGDPSRPLIKSNQPR